MWKSLVIAIAICLISKLPTCSAQSDEDFFESNVRPLLVKHCQECHGEKKQEGGLRLDSRDGWLRGGERGQTIHPGQPENSLLLQAVKYEDSDLEMPPSNPLTEQEVAILETWVKRGATDPRTKSVTSTAMSLEEAKDFWAFQPLKKTTPPRANFSFSGRIRVVLLRSASPGGGVFFHR